DTEVDSRTGDSIRNATVSSVRTGAVLLVTANSTLLLLNDTLSDFVTSQGGKIQVDGAANGTGTGSTLELQNTTINGGGAITHPRAEERRGGHRDQHRTTNTTGRRNNRTHR